MLKNYFKTALRSLWNNKGYGFLNIAGLAVGIASAALIFLWVEDELTYNHHHADIDRIYRVMEHQTFDGTIYTMGATPGVLARGMQEEIPGVALTARTNWGARKLFSLADKSIFEEGIYMDSSFFKIFDFPFLQGNAAKPFSQLHSIVISRQMAERFFENPHDAFGKSIKMDNEQEYLISGVFEDLPANSSFDFDWAVPFKLYVDENQWLTDWASNGIITYAKLAENADPAQVNAQLLGYIKSKNEEAVAQAFLFPITDWRLYSKFENGKQVGGLIQFVRLFSTIAWIILIIACINFMNLATARSEKRAREVGVRKVLGAGRGRLVLQFMTESLLLSFIAVVLSVGIIYLCINGFNKLVEKELAVNIFDPLHFLALLGIGVLCGIIAGSYPALYLSSFNPVTVFKGLRIKGNTSAGLIRKGLVVTQFAASIVLIIGTIVIYEQIQHIKSRDLGYNKEQVVYMNLQGKMNERFSVIRQDLLASGMVAHAAVSNQRVLQMGNNGWGYEWKGKDPNQQILITNENVSHDYLKTMGMRLKSGRDFKPIEAQDSNSIIINESLAKLMNKEEAVGEIISSDSRDFEIIGVVHDFVYSDVYAPAAPLILFAQPSATNFLFVRLRQGVNMPDALAKLESVLKAHNPGYPFEYKFLDEEFDNLFKSEMLIGKLSRIFAMLAIFISCLGLFGLAAYTAERRTKEIGIRKVLGASAVGIASLLSLDFLKLVFVSFLLAFPLAWYLMHQWLQDFAYRISINWTVFLVAGVAAILIALFTISFQAIRAALSNPVKNLRTE
jgi:putative ABC transport system permease protein